VKPAPFDYFDPTTVEETLGLLGEFGDEAKLLAGGQSLLPMLNLRLARPSKLVDINGVTALAHLGTDGDDLLIGALTRQRTLEDADLPDGAMLAIDGVPYAVRGARLLRWSFEGYGDALPRRAIKRTTLITPPLFVTILANGFAPRWHDSAG